MNFTKKLAETAKNHFLAKYPTAEFNVSNYPMLKSETRTYYIGNNIMGVSGDNVPAFYVMTADGEVMPLKWKTGEMGYRGDEVRTDGETFGDAISRVGKKVFGFVEVITREEDEFYDEEISVWFHRV